MAIEKNLLPIDGEVFYFENFLDNVEANFYFKILFETINWQNDKVKIFGKGITTKRKVAWYSADNKPYKYSGIIKNPQCFTKELNQISKKIESILKTSFNGCLLNLYHNGNEGMGWHSDNEPEIIQNSMIASLSLGTARNFAFKHKFTNEKITINLLPGSLLVMLGATQQYWHHTLLKSTKVTEPRINLTFRQMINT